MVTRNQAETMKDSMKLSFSGKLKTASLFRSHWKGLTIALVAVLGETLADVLQPWPIKVVVDNILQAKKLPKWLDGIVSGLFGHDNLAILTFAVAAVAAIAILDAVSSYIEQYMTTDVSQWVAHDLRRTLYNHIQRLSLAEHDVTRTGDLISRVTADIDAVRSFVNSALLGILVDILILVGMIGIMLYVNWRFTLIALSVVPVLFGVVYYLTRRIKQASRAVRKRESELTSIVEEGLTSVRVVKAFAREDFEVKRFESESLGNVETALRARSLKAKLLPLVEVIVAIGTCMVLWFGARLALGGQISAGVLIVFLLYLGKMYKPMRDLNFTHLDIDRSRGFGIVTEDPKWVAEGINLLMADCKRSPYSCGLDSFVVSPANARKVLGNFLKRAHKQLLIYDPKISDEEMIRILHERAKAGVEIRVIGQTEADLPVRELSKLRLHTRMIVRDERQAFISSQSLRAAELDSRREVGLIVRDAKIVKKLMETFESDWASLDIEKTGDGSAEKSAAPKQETDQAMRVLIEELHPIATTVKKAVQKVVSQVGEEVLEDGTVQETVAKVVKKVVKQAARVNEFETSGHGI